MSIIKNYVPAKGICKVTFSYPTTDGVQSVQVLGDFNNWDSKVAPKMKKSKMEFTTAIELAVGKTYEFRYLLNNEQWDNDFNADKYVSAPYVGITNSVLILDAVTDSAKASKPAATKATPAKKETVKVSGSKTAKASAPKAAAPKATKAAASAKAATPKAEVKKEVAKAKPAAAAKSPIAKVVKVDLKK